MGTGPPRKATAHRLCDSRTQDSAVLCITGNGLKTLDAVMGHCGAPREIKPSLREFETLLGAGDQVLV